MADRDFLIQAARVYLHESACRRDSRVNRNFHWQLFAWAQDARRRAFAPVVSTEPQLELFA
jgi:hypothetical protein